jgi:nitronate monooxygenase
LTNVFTGRPARSIVNRAIREAGPMNNAVQEFPLAAAALSPLRAKTEGMSDFVPLWYGQSAALGRDVPATVFTTELAAATQALLESLSTAARGRNAAKTSGRQH